MKISVIIPVYNAEKYLHQCLESVVNQTLNEIEIICVDDCSTDSSCDILQSYAAIDERLKVINFDKNKSAVQARKTGVLAAVGKYIMFVDADDYLVTGALEFAYALAEKSDTDIIHFGANVINCEGISFRRMGSIQSYVIPFNGTINADNLVRACTVEKKINHLLWGKLFKANVCKQGMAFIEDEYFPRANDLYAFILISYFAKTYRGDKRKLYIHCYGRGGRGRMEMNIEEFELYCATTQVISAIERFFVSQDVLEAYKDVLEYRKKVTFNVCFETWKHHMNKEYLSQGIDLMIYYFGKDAVISALNKSEETIFMKLVRHCKNYGCISTVKLIIKIVAYKIKEKV